jgi:hypothetical protein
MPPKKIIKKTNKNDLFQTTETLPPSSETTQGKKSATLTQSPCPNNPLISGKLYDDSNDYPPSAHPAHCRQNSSSSSIGLSPSHHNLSSQTGNSSSEDDSGTESEHSKNERAKKHLPDFHTAQEDNSPILMRLLLGGIFFLSLYALTYLANPMIIQACLAVISNSITILPAIYLVPGILMGLGALTALCFSSWLYKKRESFDTAEEQTIPPHSSYTDMGHHAAKHWGGYVKSLFWIPSYFGDEKKAFNYGFWQHTIESTKPSKKSARVQSRHALSKRKKHSATNPLFLPPSP